MLLFRQPRIELNRIEWQSFLLLSSLPKVSLTFQHEKPKAAKKRRNHIVLLHFIVFYYYNMSSMCRHSEQVCACACDIV